MEEHGGLFSKKTGPWRIAQKKLPGEAGGGPPVPTPPKPKDGICEDVLRRLTLQ